MKFKVKQFSGATIEVDFNTWADANPDNRVQSIVAVGDSLIVLYIVRPDRPV